MVNKLQKDNERMEGGSASSGWGVKKILDIISIISVVFMIFILPIIAHYDTELVNHATPGDHKWPISITLILVNALPFVFSCLWLIIRYGDQVAKKYPIIDNKRFLFFYKSLSY